MGKPDRDFSEKLISEVEKRPLLYDTTCADYKDRGKVDREWAYIAEIMGTTAETVRKKWQNLRGSFSKSISAMNMPCGSGTKKNKYFYLNEQMAFLRNHMAHSPMTDNYRNIGVAVSDAEDVEQEALSPSSSSSRQDPSYCSGCQSAATMLASHSHSLSSFKKRKIDCEIDSAISEFNIKRRNEKRTDPDLIFFSGLLPQIKELSKRRKRQLFQHVSFKLFELLNEQDAEEESSITTIDVKFA